MAAFCLTTSAVNTFLKGLRSGEINPEKLSKMESQERNEFLGKYVGKENAQQVNALFESKLLLKNQQAGMITWAKKVAGLKPKVRADLFARIEKLDRVLNPAEQEAFLKDLASVRLGVNVTAEEAKHISDLSKMVVDSRQAMSEGGDRMNYGRAKVALGNYVNDLKEEAGKRTILEQVKDPVKALSSIAGLTKSLKASLDNSAIFRQGWKTLFTHPGQWQRNARKSFLDFARTVGGQKVMDEVNADIVSRPNYDLMVKAKLAVGTIEEAFPSQFPEKIPGVGRLFKASETAFTAFVYRQRADVFDKYIEIAERSGVNLKNEEELKSIGKLVNSLTGRGNLGALEPAANVVNNVFFSPRSIKSHIDTLTVHALDPKFSSFARKQAAYNLVKITVGMAAILAIANGIDDDSVDFDPRSSDFGKIKVGDTRFDVSGGMSSLVTLASRLITQSSKSSTTGRISKLNSGEFGSQTGLDVVYNFFENKLSPVSAVVKNILKGETFEGKKPTVIGEVTNLLMPLPISNYLELKENPNSANILIAMIADGLGIGTNTYARANKVDWKESTSKELMQFREVVGEEKFKSANDEYNKELVEWMDKTVTKEEFQNLSEENKKKVISDGKEQIKQNIFKRYKFRYKKPRATEGDRRESKTVKSLSE